MRGMRRVGIDPVLDRPGQQQHIDLTQRVAVLDVLARYLQLQAVAILERVEERSQLDLEFVNLAGLEQLLAHERMKRPAGMRTRCIDLAERSFEDAAAQRAGC